MKYISIFFLLFFSNCTFNTSRENREEDKKEAEKVTQKFFTLIKENNKQALYNLFSDKFFNVTSNDQLNQMLDIADKEGGKIKKITLSHWETNVVKGTDPKSEYYLAYYNIRDKMNTEEIFSLQKENNDIKIVGYKINLDNRKRDTIK